MAGGGRRPGAGRKPGSATTKTREIAERAIAEGITPLEVMLTAMRHHADASRWDEAAGVAKDCAPYIHPRLAAVEHKGPDDGPIRISINGTDADL
ncbi:hypothetical protein [Methylobacterium sp. 1030]|uniref:hypothetical protein n=1 Tax=Methylobacterium sp. 1030 TaxID=3156404 RepID=UPI003390C539